MIRIGALDLEAAPRIAVPLDDRRLGERVASARPWADVVELRVDMFGAPDPDAAVAACKLVRGAGAPVLVTVRSRSQGGAGTLDDEQRLALYAAAAPHADAVDVELRSPICDAVVRLARDQGITAIVSHHDFAATPDDTTLDALADETRERGATITKIAAMAAGAGDRNRLLDLLRQRVAARQGMIVIAMGPHGAASRVFFPLCGSLLTYGFLDEAVAPGQLSIRDLRAELARYCPEAGVRSED